MVGKTARGVNICTESSGIRLWVDRVVAWSVDVRVRGLTERVAMVTLVLMSSGC